MKATLKKLVALTFVVMIAVASGCSPAEEGNNAEANAPAEESAE